MTSHGSSTLRISLIVALGGFLMGFDASVISGVVGFIRVEYSLTEIEVGWAVASLTLTSTLAMLTSGPLCDRFGRRPVLQCAAILFLVSALACAIAPNYLTLVAARMVGGLGVGAALIVAPMYIAEIAPRERRGQLVSFNQLNIVIGISAAYFSNYLLLQFSDGQFESLNSTNLWRWMLGVEAIPAVLYLFALRFVPESPRWLFMTEQRDLAAEVLMHVQGEREGRAELDRIEESIRNPGEERGRFRDLLDPALSLVLVVGIIVAVLQQITGINAVFFYAPTIFEASGIGSDASFMQAVLVGLVNLFFTVFAILMIDRIGRRPLLQFGVGGIAVFMLLLSFSFHEATYRIDAEMLPEGVSAQSAAQLIGREFDSEKSLREALSAALGEDADGYADQLVRSSIQINATLVLVGILGFVACFAFSLGPVMWVLLSELFPNMVRGVAISCMGLINSSVSFLVQLVFPWELTNLGPSLTFLVYGVFAAIGLVLVTRLVPETRGKSLEELESMLVRSRN